MRVPVHPFNGRLNSSLILKGPRPYIDPVASPYLADPTGVVDATAAINAALQAAVLVGVGNNVGCDVNLGVGTYKISDTLTIPHGSAQYGGVGLVGHAPWTTVLSWVGATDGRPAILVDKQFQFHLGNFTLSRSTSSRGTSIGILFNSSTGTGTQTISGMVYPLSIQGFNHGLHLGPDGGATYVSAVSELVFQFAQCGFCDIGAYLDSYNTLNIVFQFLATNNCGTGLYTSSAGQVYTQAGASADNSAADFHFGTNARNSIRNWRAERPWRLLDAAMGTHELTNIVIADYPTIPTHDNVAVELSGSTARVMLKNVDFGKGQVVVSNGGGNGGAGADLGDKGWVSAEMSTLGGPCVVNVSPDNPALSMNGVRASARLVSLMALDGTHVNIIDATWRGQNAGVMQELSRVDVAGRVGWYGVTPPVRPTLAAAASDPATVITLANSIRTALLALGLGQ